jgi:streptomycin 6-kinase
MSEPARFPVPDIVRRRAASEGEAGLAWLANLDDVLGGLEQDWGLTIGPALPGGTAAYVAEATTETGEIFILKLGTPGTAVGRHEAEVLRCADGRGYARLLRHDPDRHAMLLERLGERLDTLELPYERQIDIMCATLLQAWMPAPADLPCPTGADKANSLAQAILALSYGAGQPCAQAVIDMALMYCQDRAAAYRPENAVLAHGDPHPANVLAVPEGEPQQFRFIDPDGLAIEPAYDLGVLLRAWHEGIAGRHAHDIARSHVRHLTRRTQVPSEAIWQWGYIERVSTGLHLLQIGQIEEGRAYLDVAEAITSTMG